MAFHQIAFDIETEAECAISTEHTLPDKAFARGLIVEVIGEPGWYRTIDPLIKSQMLYP
jgi:hypothetical protein